jgi:hypothetical protein
MRNHQTSQLGIAKINAKIKINKKEQKIVQIKELALT